MKKREANFGGQFRAWVRSNPGILAGPYELKHTSTSSISFGAVSDHQLASLLACKSDKGFLYKISDESTGYKPFDFIYFRNSPAYIVIKFPGHFEIIDVETYVREMKKSKKKSLTSQRAKEISIVGVKLK